MRTVAHHHADDDSQPVTSCNGHEFSVLHLVAAFRDLSSVDRNFSLVKHGVMLKMCPDPS